VTDGGLGFEWIDGTLAAWASRVDVLMFNRAFGIGQQSPATEASVRAIAERFDRAGVSRSFLQIAPGASPARLTDWLEPNGYVPYNRWAKLARPLVDLPPVSERVRIDVIGPERAADFGRVLADTFRMPPAIGAWESALVAGRVGATTGLRRRHPRRVRRNCSWRRVSRSWARPARSSGARPRGPGRAHREAALRCGGVGLHARGRRDRGGHAGEAGAFVPQPVRHGFELCYFRPNYLRVPAARASMKDRIHVEHTPTGQGLEVSALGLGCMA